MSSQKHDLTAKNGFVGRFIEVCGTDQPARIQQLFNISYQSAKNYLEGRLPDTKQLLLIAENSPYSIHWLLTGRGKKFVERRPDSDTPLPARQIEEFVRNIVLDVLNERDGRRDAGQPRIVGLQSSDVYSERVPGESTASSSQRYGTAESSD